MMGTADTTLVDRSRIPARPAPSWTSLRNAFLLALPLALSLVGLGGWLVAGRALRPMRVIAGHRRARHRPRSRPADSRFQRRSGNHPRHPRAQPDDGSPGKQFPSGDPLQRRCLARVENPARHHAGRAGERPAGSASRLQGTTGVQQSARGNPAPQNHHPRPAAARPRRCRPAQARDGNRRSIRLARRRSSKTPASLRRRIASCSKWNSRRASRSRRTPPCCTPRCSICS